MLQLICRMFTISLKVEQTQGKKDLGLLYEVREGNHLILTQFINERMKISGMRLKCLMTLGMIVLRLI